MKGRSKLDLPFSIAPLVLVLLLQGCVTNPFLSLTGAANQIARAADWRPTDIATTEFRLRIYRPRQINRAEEITIYIEGDGNAWTDTAHPSPDPTPRNPLGLKLAIAQPDGPAAYIARPCQYIIEKDRQHCAYRYWTEARYSEPVIKSVSQAVDHLKSIFNAERVRLVGYSGGGAVAALIAARRDDISFLITIAANLDTDYWIKFLKVAPLSGSLNPAGEKVALRRQRQLHFVGGKDDIVPPSVARSYANKVDPSLLQSIRYIENADHDCCWVELWPDIIRKITP